MASLYQKLMGAALKPVIRGMSKRRFATQEGEFTIQGINADVEIRRDAEGVPYIYGKSRADVFFGQGFVHGQDRLWQMEVSRRVAMGRLCEVFGEAALDADRAARVFGFHRIAHDDYDLIDDDLKTQLEAYCAGINAAIAQFGKKLPVEFRLVKHTPEPWEPLHALALTRLMTLQLSQGWGHELARARLYEALDPEIAREFDVRHDPTNPPTLPNGIERHTLAPDGTLKGMDGPNLKQLGGSNAWALSGSRTDTGKPYLCSDPHLQMMMPGIWYQVYLEAPDMRVQGVSIPGLPLVMIGHNRHISWGITLSFSDIQDLFVEEFKDKSRREYKFKDEWKKAEVFKETIRIKGKSEAHIEEVVVTHHGPVVSEVIETGKQVLCLNSPALRSSAFTMGWYRMDCAEGWDEFVAAMKYIEAPGLNVVYADVEGNIGYWMTGKTPIRAQGRGETPVPGWSGEYEWTGTVPFEEMPHTLNPERGYVISANNKVVPDDFPYDMGNSWMNGYRATRIKELLEAKEKWALKDFPAVHLDVYCPPGKRFAAHFKDVPPPKVGHIGTALRLLLEWDGMLDRDSVGGTIYKVTKRFLSEQLLEVIGVTGVDDMKSALGHGPNQILIRVSEFQGKETVALLDMLDNPDSKVLAKAGGKHKALKRALTTAVTYLRKHMGKDPAQWKWGKLHQVTFIHSMAVAPPMDRVFNAGPYPTHGDTDTVCQTSIHPDAPFAANLACPSYRHIIDLSDFNNSRWIKPPGQSGQLGHANYSDQVDPWLNGGYFPMPWDRPQVEALTPKVLWLRKGE
ncbi:MAG: penicillin acylase family protein [Bacteroidota bacterium]